MKPLNTKLIQNSLEEFRNNIKKSTNNLEKNLITEKLVTSIVGSEASSIWIYDEKRSILVRKRDSSFVRELSTKHKKGVIYKAFMTKKAGIYNNLATEIEYDDVIDNPDNIKMKSKIIIPILDNERLIGIATAYSSVKQVDKFTDYNFNIFKTIVPYIMDAMYQMKEYKGVERRKRTDTRYQEVPLKIEELDNSTYQKSSSDELLSYMAAVVHDIRTPANSLHGFLDLLEEKIDDIRLKQYIRNAKESASFINELTTSILDKASNRDLKSTATTELVNTAVFFSKISEIFISNMHDKRISFNVFIDPLLPREIEIDTLKLKRVILNLIGNAYKFTPTYECIEFSVRYKQKDKKIHIFVKDTGIGIAKEKQAQIFEEFKQAEDDTSSKYGGHGLGLSICAAYVKELGGNLHIDSEFDKGSTFYFDIPVKFSTKDVIFKPLKNNNANILVLMDRDNSCSSNNIARYLVRMGIDKTAINGIRNLKQIDENSTHMIVDQKMMTPEVRHFCKVNKMKLLLVENELFSISIDKNTKEELIISQFAYFADVLYSFIDINDTPRVLIADDDRISVSLLKNILAEELCIIETAYNGEIAMELIENSIKSKRPFDIIFMDNYMPMFSGDEVVNTLRGLEQRNELKRAFVSSISGDEYSRNDKNSNYDSYTTKPFDKREIRDIFRKVIAK